MRIIHYDAIGRKPVILSANAVETISSAMRACGSRGMLLAAPHTTLLAWCSVMSVSKRQNKKHRNLSKSREKNSGNNISLILGWACGLPRFSPGCVASVTYLPPRSRRSPRLLLPAPVTAYACACYCLRLLLPAPAAGCVCYFQFLPPPLTVCVCNAPGCCNVASGATQRCCNAPVRWNVASGATQRSRNAPERCNCAAASGASQCSCNAPATCILHFSEPK